LGEKDWKGGKPSLLNRGKGFQKAARRTGEYEREGQVNHAQVVIMRISRGEGRGSITNKKRWRKTGRKNFR